MNLPKNAELETIYDKALLRQLQIIGGDFASHAVVQVSAFDPAHHANYIWLPISSDMAMMLGVAHYNAEPLQSFLEIIRKELDRLEASTNFDAAKHGDVDARAKLNEQVVYLAATIKLALSMRRVFVCA